MLETRLNLRLLVILTFILAVLMQACSTPTILPEDLIGENWFFPEEALFVEFFDDGTFLAVSGPSSVDGQGAFARRGEYSIVQKNLIQIERGNAFSETESQFSVEVQEESLLIGENLLFKMDDKLSQLPITGNSGSRQQYIGLWENQNNGTRSVPAVYVFLDQNDKLLIQSWGACQPDWCDWGVTEAAATDQFLYAFWDHDFSIIHMILVPTGDDELRINKVTYFNDNSDRSEFTTREDYIRSPELSVPSGQD